MTTAERTHPNQRMTFEEAALLDPDEQHGEIVAGAWFPVTRSPWRHGEIASAAGYLLELYARQQGGWSVAIKSGVKLARNPDTLRRPDIAVVRSERVPQGKGVEGWLEGAPDLAVEVVGDSQSYSEMTKKALEYLAAGAKMVWLVDAEPRRVVLFTQPAHVQILGPDEVLEGGDVLPGFSCRVAEMFE